MMGLDESTHKLYACGVRRFMGICSTAGRTPVPANEDTLCHFAAALAVEGLHHRTIKSYMAGVHHLHISEGHEDPFSAGLHRLHYVLWCVKHAEGMAGVTKRERRPITPDLLRKINRCVEFSCTRGRCGDALGGMLSGILWFYADRGTDSANR